MGECEFYETIIKNFNDNKYRKARGRLTTFVHKTLCSNVNEDSISVKRINATVPETIRFHK